MGVPIRFFGWFCDVGLGMKGTPPSEESVPWRGPWWVPSNSLWLIWVVWGHVITESLAFTMSSLSRGGVLATIGRGFAMLGLVDLINISGR